MYAVISTGGKQYRVRAGDIVQIEKLEGEVGSAVKFDQVLLVGKAATAEGEKSQISLGKPAVSGAAVGAEIVGQGRGIKIVMYKYRRRKKLRRTKGHRQFYTQVLITSIAGGSVGSAELSSQDKTTRLSKFNTQLKAPGQAFTPKTLGSRKRMKEAAAKASGTAGSTSGAKPKAAAAAPKKTVTKSAAPKKK